MPWAAIGAIGGAVSGIGSLFGGSSTQKESNKAADNTLKMYEDTKKQLEPFYDSGKTGYTSLADLYGAGPDTGSPTYGSYLKPLSDTVGAPPSPNDASLKTDFKSSPGYQFLVDQGNQAIQNGAAAKTGALSGNALKSMDKYTTGLADQDWWNYYKGLQTNYYDRYNDASYSRGQNIAGLEWLGGSGQSAANQTGAYGSAATSSASNYRLYGSNAASSGYSGFGNALKSLGSYGSSSGSGSSSSSDTSGGWDYGAGAVDTNTGNDYGGGGYSSTYY